MLYIILAVVALLSIGGMSSCAYKKGHDSRDQEVAQLRVLKEAAEANVAQRDGLIEKQNAAVAEVAKVGQTVKGLQATIIKDSRARQAADASRITRNESIARSGGSESAKNCPQTASILGDLSDIMRAGAVSAAAPVVAPAAIPRPPDVPLPPKPTPLPPKPVLPSKVKP